MKPQKHAALIHLWADGAEIEVWDGGDHNRKGRWEESCLPDWFESCKYRVKPKPGVVREVALSLRILSHSTLISVDDRGAVPNAKLTFDGETGELKGCEFITGETYSEGTIEAVQSFADKNRTVELLKQLARKQND
jgi:hypothetical protein